MYNKVGFKNLVIIKEVPDWFLSNCIFLRCNNNTGIFELVKKVLGCFGVIILGNCLGKCKYDRWLKGYN